MNRDVFFWAIESLFQSSIMADCSMDHPGICKMKALTQCYLWWPSLDKDIKAKAKSCFVCRTVQNTPQPAPLHPWIWPSIIWQRLHIDYAQKGNSNFLVIIYSYSKWLEVFETRNTSAESTCDLLWTLFASFGLPEEEVSDNGPQFTSSIIKSFLKNNGVKQTLTPLCHPASNGATERSVQILKQSLAKQVLHSGDKFKHLASLQLSYLRIGTFCTWQQVKLLLQCFLKEALEQDCHYYT